MSDDALPLGEGGSASADEESPGFDALLGQLEKIVVELERGELTLEDALNRFERGMGLAQHASAVLEDAEMRVDKLIRERGKLVTVPLDDDASG